MTAPELPGPALLFCPADRPDRFAKAAAAADGVILRATLLDPSRTIVRINPAGTHDHEHDLAAIAGTPYTLVMLAKAESAAQVDALAPRRVLALCETPAGVLAAAGIAAAAPTAGLMWG